MICDIPSTPTSPQVRLDAVNFGDTFFDTYGNLCVRLATTSINSPPPEDHSCVFKIQSNELVWVRNSDMCILDPYKLVHA